MLLRFVGQDKDYDLRSGLVYPCKVYTKKNFIWVRARNYALKFPKRYVYIPYVTIERLYSEWRAYGDIVDDSRIKE